MPKENVKSVNSDQPFEKKRKTKLKAVINTNKNPPNIRLPEHRGTAEILVGYDAESFCSASVSTPIHAYSKEVTNRRSTQTGFTKSPGNTGSIAFSPSHSHYVYMHTRSQEHVYVNMCINTVPLSQDCFISQVA